MSNTTDITTAAATLGRKGGKSTSEAKAAAVRENGKLGGRPPMTQAQRAAKHAAAFARAYNAEDMDTCDRIAQTVAGSEHASGGLRPHQRWDRDANLTRKQAEQFLADL